MVRWGGAALVLQTLGCSLLTDLSGLDTSNVASSCPGVHTFCDDFDSHDLGVLWTSVTQTGGPMGLDTTTDVSPPRSLLVTATAGATKGISALRKDFTMTSKIDIAFDAFIEPGTNDTTYEVDPVRLDYQIPPAGFVSYSVHVSLYDTGPVIEEGGSDSAGNSNYTTTPLPANVTFPAPWQHYVLEVDASNAAATLSIAGTVIATHTITRPPSGSVQLVIGGAYEEGITGWRIHVDNVAVDVF